MTTQKTTIPVYCAFAAMVDPADLKPYPGNPNTHPAEQLRLLTRAILERGWRHPIIISRLSGCIVAGHARQTVAIAMQLPTVPVDYQDFESAAKEREFVLADNRMAELAEMDNEALKGMIASLADDPDALEVAGYTAAMVAELTAKAEAISIDAPPESTTPDATRCYCPKCGFAFEVAK